MKKLTLLIIALTVLVLLTNCSKNTNTTVAVVVHEKGTTNPAVGIPVNFGYSSTGGVFAGQIVEQTKTTDANGRVSFEGQEKDKNYSVGYPNGADYFGDGTSLKEGNNGTVFLYTYPFAYVRVHAKNVNPYDNNDWISISNGGLGGGGVLYGVNIDTVVIKGPFRGTGYGNFGWNIRRKGILTDFSIQLYYIGRDTINYTINY